MKRYGISLVVAGLLAIAAIAPATAQETVDFDLDEVDESGVTGTVTMTAENGETHVMIELEGNPEDGVHPVHIHEGTCEDLGPVAYPLEDVVDGESETTVEVELSELLAGEYAVNVHLSEDDMATWVACGNLPDADMEDDDAVEEDDDAVEEDDDAVEEDDDAVEEDDDAVEDDDDAVVEDEEDDDVEDVVPAAGSTGGVGTDTAAVFMVLLAGAALGSGVILRRRQYQTQA